MTVRINNLSDKSGFLAFIAASFAILLLGLHNDFMPPFIIAWLLFWAIGFTSRNLEIAEDEYKARVLLFLFIGLNLIFLIGLFFSDDSKNGSVLLFRRLSMLILPIVLFSPGYDIRKRIDVLLKIFVAGITAYMLFCFCNALFHSIIITDDGWSFDSTHPEKPWLNYFYGHLLAVGQHPSYIAMYSLMGVLISLEFLFQKTSECKERMGWLAMAVFLFVSLYFLSSRAAFLAVLVILPVFLWLKLKPVKFKVIAFFSFLIFISLVSFLFLNNQRVKIYFDESIDRTILKDGRVEIWKSALRVVEKNPLFGAGIGDYYQEMEQEFQASGYTTGYYKDFNAHSQYLEILCMSGIIGFLVFLVIIITMLSIAIKERNLLYGSFIIMMLIFFSFESLLSRFAGNSFFALFAFLLIHYKRLPGVVTQD